MSAGAAARGIASHSGVGEDDPVQVVDRFGSSSASAFLLGPDCSVVELPGGGVTGVAYQGRYALMATGPVSPDSRNDAALDEVLEFVGARRFRPVFVTVSDPERYERRGLFAYPMSEEAILDLAGFTLSGKRMASVRHSVTSARRAGMTIVPWSEDLAGEVEAVSREWVASKRGPESGFIVGRFEPRMVDHSDCYVALDAANRVVGFATWRRYDNGNGRGLDLIRRRIDAPNPTMDLLLAESLARFAEQGLPTASLGCVQHAHGDLLERVYPTRSLRKFKDKFAPQWQPRFIIVPSRMHLAPAALALARVCVPGGVWAIVKPQRPRR